MSYRTRYPGKTLEDFHLYTYIDFQIKYLTWQTFNVSNVLNSSYFTKTKFKTKFFFQHILRMNIQLLEYLKLYNLNYNPNINIFLSFHFDMHLLFRLNCIKFLLFSALFLMRRFILIQILKVYTTLYCERKCTVTGFDTHSAVSLMYSLLNVY